MNRDLRLLIYAFLSMIITYFIFNPYQLLSPSEFIDTVKYEKDLALGGIGYFDLTFHIKNFKTLFYSFGTSFAICILSGMVLSAIYRKKQDIILLFCTLAYYLVFYKIISYPKNIYYGYTHIAPLIPLLVIFGARFLGFLYAKQKNKIFVGILIAFIILNSFTNSLFYSLKLKTQPKIEAGTWINNNIAQGSSIGTWIVKDGHRPGYPPFDYLSYKFINDPSNNLSKILSLKPDYYIAISIPYLKDPFFDNEQLMGAYQEIKTFESKIPVLSKFYSSKLLHFWVDKITIFKKI